jgi:DNA-binding NarL/FixJ family response regulator
MRILLIDDQQSARFALCTLLEQHPGWQVVGEATSTERLLPLVESSHPDVILLNWNLLELMPLEIISRLHDTEPKVSVIVLSGRPEDQQAALAAGADLFVSKVDSPKRLIDAITAISKDQTGITD